MATVIKRWLSLKIFVVRQIKINRVAILDFKRANIKLFRQILSSVPWESVYEGLGVHK